MSYVIDASYVCTHVCMYKSVSTVCAMYDIGAVRLSARISAQAAVRMSIRNATATPKLPPFFRRQDSSST